MYLFKVNDKCTEHWTHGAYKPIVSIFDFQDNFVHETQ